jgi:hypothetical protein
LECKGIDANPPGAKPSLTLPADQADDADSRRSLLGKSISAAICSIRAISGETHSETRRLGVGQSLFGLTLEMVELFYILLVLNQVILEEIFLFRLLASLANEWFIHSIINLGIRNRMKFSIKSFSSIFKL